MTNCRQPASSSGLTSISENMNDLSPELTVVKFEIKDLAYNVSSDIKDLRNHTTTDFKDLSYKTAIEPFLYNFY